MDMKKIIDTINELGIKNYELYGDYMSKIDIDNNGKQGKLILVTSINPTPYGEGKTTTSIGLVDSLNKLGKKCVGSLRDPSMGQVFGKKGGAIGGGKAKIVPEDKINLNFTGDFHAITYANNLISAVIDNSIYQGNELGIETITFNRCLDVNDRSLRNVIVNGKETSFVITPASELMSIVGLSETMSDLRTNLGNILVGYTSDNKEIYVKDLKLVDSLMHILEDAVKPNLVNTLYGNPVLVHTGPFANISYGCSSIKSIKSAMTLGEYAVTEAGFGSDTGAVKFFDLLGRKGNIYPDVVVINTTVRAIKYQGIDNLGYHINNMKKFCDNIVISLNKFDTDTVNDVSSLEEYVSTFNVKLCISTMYSDGEDGCLDLANEIINMGNNTKKYEIYNLNDSLKEKINKIRDVFGASNIKYDSIIEDKINTIDKLHPNLPICICKTPYSITDNKDILGHPKDFDMTITDIKVYNGAGYIVIYMGDVLTMPGLAKESNYMNEVYNG